MTTELKEHERSDAVDLATPSPVRNPGILIADDAALILTLLKFELESRGFNVWLGVDGDDALDLYRRHREEIDLVLLDVQMPGLDGPHTLEALRRLNPDVVACFMTGNLAHYQEQDLLDCGVAWVFSKPFRPADIADLLEKVLLTPDSEPSVRGWQAPWERKRQPRPPRSKSAPSPRN
jgi:CheY-like chemotaxis protein